MRTRLFILQLTTVVFVAGFMRLFGQNLAASPQPSVAHLPDGNSAASNTAPSASAIASQFVLGTADVIKINVWKNADLSQTVTIGPDGFVSLPLLGDVHVAGMTPNQLAQDLNSRLSS
jgi:polysaccharide biosynthesis/export protein